MFIDIFVAHVDVVFEVQKGRSGFDRFLWKEFVFNRSAVKRLAIKYDRSIHWIGKELRAYEPPLPIIVPREMVAVVDCVFFGRTSGYLVVRDPH